MVLVHLGCEASHGSSFGPLNSAEMPMIGPDSLLGATQNILVVWAGLVNI